MVRSIRKRCKDATKCGKCCAVQRRNTTARRMPQQPEVPSPEPPAPRRLGNYEILDKLGEGGMGEVWRARDERLNRTVAVKILPPDLANDPQRRARFEQEARSLGALNHPNIVAVYDFGQDNGRSYIVSELVDGESLRSIIDRGP